MLLGQLGLSVRDFSLAELKHSTNETFHDRIKEVFDAPVQFTEEKIKAIFEEMY